MSICQYTTVAARISNLPAWIRHDLPKKISAMSFFWTLSERDYCWSKTSPICRQNQPETTVLIRVFFWVRPVGRYVCIPLPASTSSLDAVASNIQAMKNLTLPVNANRASVACLLGTVWWYADMHVRRLTDGWTLYHSHIAFRLKRAGSCLVMDARDEF